MNKAGSIIMLIVAIIVASMTFNYNDDNLNVYRRLLCEQALLVGNIPTFNEQNSKITKEEYKFKDFEYINLKKELLSEKNDNENVVSRIDKISNPSQRAVLFALMAINGYKDGNISKYNNYILKSYVNITSVSPVISERYCFEIVRRLIDVYGKLPQEHAVDFIKVPYYSNNQVLIIYAMGGKKYCVEKIKRLLKDKKFVENNKRFVGYFKKVVLISNIKNMKDKDVERNFWYSAIEFSMTWKIKKWNNYKFPLMAYAYYIGGDYERYKIYRDMSISREQLEDMKASYFGYVEYVSKIFYITKEPNISNKLLATLPNGHKKNLLIKNMFFMRNNVYTEF